jgi:hypothetical protein
MQVKTSLHTMHEAVFDLSREIRERCRSRPTVACCRNWCWRPPRRWTNI